MLRKVWPGLHFWYSLGIVSSPLWVFFLSMEFVKKTTGLAFVFLVLAIVLSWSASNFMLSKFYFSLLRHPETDRLFRDYKGVGKTMCYALLSLGNVALYYLSEKSVAYMLTFLSLAVYSLCTILCIQPHTDFGSLEFLLSASLNEALSLFGLRSWYSWLIITACIIISGIRYRLLPGDATKHKIDLESGQSRAMNDPDQDVIDALDDSVKLDRAFKDVTVVSVVSVTSTMDVGNSFTESVPYKVTNTTTENSNIIPPESTTAANVGALSSPGLTVASSLTIDGADQDQLRAKARDDAINLNRAFEGFGFGCDATTIVNILSVRSATNRMLIKEEYKAMFSEDFDNRLSKELMFKPDLKRAILLWMDEPACRDAKLVKDGLRKKISVAIEVICSRTPSQIEQLRKCYRKMFGVYLLEDIESHARFDYKQLLLEYAGKQRSESLEVDERKVDEDASIIFRDGVWKPGTNKETFIRILCERSSAHLTALNSAYRTRFGSSLMKAVKKETSFKVKFALLTILKCAENRAKYFAKALHKAMKGIGTDDETLTRIIVSRAEVDIQQIKAEYEKKYGKALADDVFPVFSNTPKHYRAFLLSLLNFNPA